MVTPFYFLSQDSTTVGRDSRTYTTRTGGIQSYGTVAATETDNLAVTSLANSCEKFTGQLMPELDARPDNNLWVVAADDPELDSMLINAVVHGEWVDGEIDEERERAFDRYT